MSQFRIKGIDYTDDSLQHGLGKGSGRGRPKGSKNGQVMPGAAYMKGYEIVGQKAAETPATPGGTRPVGNQRSAQNSRQNRTSLKVVGGANRARPITTAQARSTVTKTTATPTTTRTTTTTTTRTSNPAATTAKGKQAVDQLLTLSASSQPRAVQKPNDSTVSNRPAATQNTQTSNTNNQSAQVQRNRDMSTAELRALDPVGDWPWSSRRVNAAGGLEAREGRQIVYDNPTLDEDYKKHIAKYYGDSDGKSYPKYLDQQNTQPAAQTAQNTAETPTLYANAANQPNSWREYLNSQQNNGALNNTSPQVQNAANNVIQRDARTQQANRNPPSGGGAGSSPIDNATNNVVGRDARTQGTQPPLNVNPPVSNAANVTVGQDTRAQNANQNQPAAQETPEQKSLWDSIGGWFNQAGKDIGNAVVSGLGTAGGAISDAAVWVGDRLKDAGDWAVTSTGDVGKWVGDRAKDFNNWWNGYDYYEQVADPNNPDASRDVQARQTGARENIGNFLGTVGQGIGDAAGAVGNWIGGAAGDVGKAIGGTVDSAGRALNNWWNGEDYYEQVADPNNPGVYRDVQAHRPGFAENATNFLTGAGQTADELLNGRERTIRRPGPNGSTTVETVRDGGIIPWVSNLGQTVANGVSDAAGAVGQAASDAAGAVGRTATNLADTVLGSYPVVDRDENGNFIYGNERQGGLLGQLRRDGGHFINQAGQLVDNMGRIIPTSAQAAAAGVPLEDIGYWNNSLLRGESTPETYGSQMQALTNDGRFVPVVDQIGNAINDNIVTPAANTVDYVRNVGSNAVRDADRWLNGTDQTFLGIPVGHTPGAIENFQTGLNNFGQTISNGTQDLGARMQIPSVVNAAQNSGVPQAALQDLAAQYQSGEITSQEYIDNLNRATEYYRYLNQ